jgi:hypothetical protein
MEIRILSCFSSYGLNYGEHLWIYFCGYILPFHLAKQLASEWLESMIRLFDFRRICQSSSEMSISFLFPKQYGRLPSLPHLPTAGKLIWSRFNYSHLLGMLWCLFVVLSCMYFLDNYVQYIFICLIYLICLL